MRARRTETGGTGSLLVPAALLIPLLLGWGCTKEAPWVEFGPPRPEETIQAMAVEAIIGLEEQWATSTPVPAYCLGVGRRVEVGLRASSREESWNPNGVFLRALGDPGRAVFPLSACSWGDNVEERVTETGIRAAAVGVSQVNWITARSASVSVSIRQDAEAPRRYACEFSRPGGEWLTVRCLLQLR